MAACPGCGVPGDGALVLGYRASATCHRLYGELTAYTLGRGDPGFIHQHAVDAYAAQHVGNGMKPITVAFALIGLYHAIERGFDGRQVQRVHMLLARRRHPWPDLPPPPGALGSRTVADVMAEPPGDGRDAALRAWMADVWRAWAEHQAWVREVSRTLLA